MKLVQRWADLLPPLSTEEFEALKADIKANGVLAPIVIDEDGAILDGHHRYKIDPNAKTRTVAGLSEAEKEAFVIRANLTRRNLSPTQKAQLHRKQKALAKSLRESDPKRWTQKRVAETLGVARSTVESWFVDRSNDTSVNASTPKPDARVKINPAHKKVIAERVQEGETQAQVAADYGVSQRAVSSVVKEQTKQAEIKQERAKAAKSRKGNNGVIEGDFRVGGKADESESFDIIFTDPPYDEESIDMYGDLAAYAARVLVKGGWLLAYSGKMHLPQTYANLSASGLQYGWTFCVLHSGGDARFRKFKLHTGWKPIVAFYKPPLNVDWDWFKDVVSGGKEKSLHEWQQAESEAAYFIERLCPTGGIVCDPFAGSGTTLSAAKSLNRRWFGYEVNPQHVDTARARLDD